jgi:leucyl aminopeptidase (aminopeptidase T)
VGDIMLDEKIAGSVHIALGMNEAGGRTGRTCISTW